MKFRIASMAVVVKGFTYFLQENRGFVKKIGAGFARAYFLYLSLPKLRDHINNRPHHRRDEIHPWEICIDFK